MNALLEPTVSQQLVLTLGHFLWQGLAVGGAVWFAGWMLRSAGARLRYRVYLAALIVMAACPIATFLSLGRNSIAGMAADRRPAGIEEKKVAHEPLEASGAGIPDPTGAVVAPEQFAAADDDLLRPATEFDREPETAGVPSGDGPRDWRSFAPWLTAAYFAGVLAMFVRLAVGLRGGRRLRRHSEPVADPEWLDLLTRRAAALGLRTTPPLAWCREIAVPTVVGVLRPAILLPMSLASGLTPDQIAGILAHELAHVRRWDPLMNVLQRVVEAVLFFHPMVWLVSRRIRRERENCCDDLVLATGSDRLNYAASLLGVAERAAAEPRAAVTAVPALRADGRPSELGGRIRRLLGAEHHEALRLNRPGLLGVVVAVVALAGLTRLAITGDGESAEQTRKPARATLPNGVVVELVGVAVNPRDERWWRPDGSLLADVPKLHGRSRVITDENSIERTFVVQAQTLADDVVHHLEVSPSRGGAISAHRENSGPLQVRAHQTIPKSATTAAVRFGFAAGEWDTVLTLSPQGARQGEPAPLGEDVEFDRLTPREDGAELVLRVPWESDAPRVEYRARVIDDAGTPHEPGRTQTSRHSNEPTELRHQYRVKLDQIREIRVEALAYRHWVTFRNVALHPGQDTEVEIEIEAPKQISRTEFAESVAVRVAGHLPFELPDHRHQTYQEFRELVNKYGPEQPSAEFVRRILGALDRHLKRDFPEGPRVEDPVVRDRHYVRLPAEIRMLQWRLFMALRQRPLDQQEQGRLVEQHEWIRRHIRSLPRPAAAFVRAGRTHESVLAELQEKIDDALNPLFKQPLSDEQFAGLQQELREHGERPSNPLVFGVPHTVGAWMQAWYGQLSEIPVPELATFDEQVVGTGQTNGRIRIEFPSCAVFEGMRNGISNYSEPGSSFISLVEPRPSIFSLDVAGAPGKAATLDELDRWFTENEDRAHLIFEKEQMRLIGMQGTRLVSLSQRRFYQVDRIPAERLIDQVEKEGSRFWKLPEPVSHNETIGESRYDALAAVLTPEGRLFILQVQGHDAAGLAFHVRLHQPRNHEIEEQAPPEEKQTPAAERGKIREPWRLDGLKPTPRSIAVTLKLDRDEFLLGESIVVGYEMTNVGKDLAPYERGAFYPTLRINDGFRMSAVKLDENDQPVGEAVMNWPMPDDFGGPAGGFSLEPKESHSTTLFVTRYLRFLEPGRYRLRIENRARLAKADAVGPYSAGEAVFTLKQPTPDEARQVFERMQQAPRKAYDDNAMNFIHGAADFEAMHQSVYLPVLEEFARRGDLDALSALERMQSLPANEALVAKAARALDRDDWQTARACYRHLQPSLPYPNWFDEPLSDHDQAHRERVARTWKADFGPVLTRLARRLGVEVTAQMRERASRHLDADAGDPEFLDHFRRGTFPQEHPQSLLKDIDFIYKCVGGPEDFADCLRAYAHSIELTKALPLETHQYFRPRGSAYGFRQTVFRMLERGAKPPTRPTHPGEAAALASALRRDAGFRPEGWQDEVMRWLKHDTPYLAELILEQLPEPIPNEALEYLVIALGHNDVDLRIAACRIAEKHPRAAYQQPLKQILESAQDEYLRKYAVDAARANGIPARYDPDAPFVDPSVIEPPRDGNKTRTDEHGGLHEPNVEEPVSQSEHASTFPHPRTGSSAAIRDRRYINLASSASFRGVRNTIPFDNIYRDQERLVSLVSLDRKPAPGNAPAYPNMLPLWGKGSPGRDATVEELERWAASHKEPSHLIINHKDQRLIGLHGTRLLPLAERRFFEADGIPAHVLVDRVKTEGSRSCKIPKGFQARKLYDPDRDPPDDVLIAALIPDGRLFLLQLQDHDGVMTFLHIRRHHPQPADGGEGPRAEPPAPHGW